jgi:hypothetical protein
VAESSGILLLNAEDNDLSGLTITEEGSNDLTISSGAALHGSLGYNFAFSGNSGENLLYFYKSFTAGADIYARCYFKFSSEFSFLDSEYFSVFSLYDSTGNYLCFPRFRWSGTKLTLDYFNCRTNTGAASSSAINFDISFDTLYYIEMRYKSGSGDGDAQLWIDGTPKASLANLANNNYQASRVWSGNWRGGVPTAGSKIYIDDIKVDSSYIGAYTESGGSSLPAIINNYRQQGVM